MSHVRPGAHLSFGWYDTLPTVLQHAILLLVAAGLTWLLDLVHSWRIPADVSSLIGAALTLLIFSITPVTKQYGLGRRARKTVAGEVLTSVDTKPTD